MNHRFADNPRHRLKQAFGEFFVAALVLSVISCASVEDFQAMSPEQRADKVCSGTDSYRQRKRSLTETDNQIREKANLLATGYRIYEQCQLISVTAPGTTVDCSGLSGADAKKCKKGNTPPTTETRRVCIETPVPIDYNYESALLRDLRMDREGQLQFHEQLTENCRIRANSLAAEEAFLLYENNGEP